MRRLLPCLCPHDQVAELAGDGGGLLYLPITFAGSTRLLRRGEEDALGARVCAEYHAHLREAGHCLSPPALAEALEAHGCQVR